VGGRCRTTRTRQRRDVCTPNQSTGIGRYNIFLPSDGIAEIYEDRRYPGRTFMELSPMPGSEASIRGVQIVFPDQAVG